MVVQLPPQGFGHFFGRDFFGEIIHEIAKVLFGEGIVDSEKAKPGTVRCLLLVYAGPNAISRIRTILGSTDPTKAATGSVRREFGTDVMVNAAHASDSPENAAREMGITQVDSETICSWVEAYYP